MKSISITFDTVIEMINDATISSGMTVSCLGYENIDDHNGGRYRIFSSLESETAKTDDDITFVSDDTLFARKIEDDLIIRINSLSKRLDNISSNTKNMIEKVDDIIKKIESDDSIDVDPVIDYNIPEREDDYIKPFDKIDKLDLSEECGIVITRYNNGVKSIFVNKFTEVDNNEPIIIEIDYINSDHTLVTIGTDVYAFDPDKVYVDKNNTTYVVSNGIFTIRYGSVAIDDITEDKVKIIIDGVVSYPVENVIYSKNDDTSYVYENGLLNEVIPIDSISDDKKHIVIMYEELDPIKDVTYIDPFGHKYTYNGEILEG